MKIKPLQDRILIRRLDSEEEMRGGIVIPDTAREKPQEGTVIAVGPGRMTDEGKRIAMEVDVGDKVIYSKYGGTEFTDGGTEYLVLRDDDVLMKL